LTKHPGSPLLIIYVAVAMIQWKHKVANGACALAQDTNSMTILM
jgi:hypothetical protein